MEYRTNNIKYLKSISCFKKNIKSWLDDLWGCSILVPQELILNRLRLFGST